MEISQQQLAQMIQQAMSQTGSQQQGPPRPMDFGQRQIADTRNQQGNVDRDLAAQQPQYQNVLSPGMGGGNQLSDPIAQIAERIAQLRAMSNQSLDQKGFNDQIQPLQQVLDMYMKRGGGNPSSGGSPMSPMQGSNPQNSSVSAGTQGYNPLGGPGISRQQTRANGENDRIHELTRQAMIHYLSIRDPHLISSLGKNPLFKG